MAKKKKGGGESDSFSDDTPMSMLGIMSEFCVLSLFKHRTLAPTLWQIYYSPTEPSCPRILTTRWFRTPHTTVSPVHTTFSKIPESRDRNLLRLYNLGRDPGFFTAKTRILLKAEWVVISVSEETERQDSTSKRCKIFYPHNLRQLRFDACCPSQQDKNSFLLTTQLHPPRFSRAQRGSY